MVLVNPYKIDDENTCVLVKHQEVYTEPDHRSINERTRNIISGIFGNISISYYVTRFNIQHRRTKIPNMINSSLKTLKDKVFLNRAHKVLFQGFEYIKERAYDCEFAFDIKQANYLDMMEKIIDYAEQRKTDNLYLTSPIGIRYTQKSDAYLTMESGRDVCYMDTPFLLGSINATELLNDLQDIFFEHGGIPHWGKTLSKSTTFI